MNNQTAEALEKRIARKYSRWKTLLLLILLPVFVLACTFGAVKVWNDSYTSGDIRRQVDSNWRWFGRTINVALIPSNSIRAGEKPVTPIGEVIFCLDTSGSMGSEDRPGDPLYESLRAIKALSKILLASGSKVGFSVFASDVRPVVKPTLSLADLRKGWNSRPRVGCGTSIPPALEKTTEMLTPDTSLIKIVALMSDGYGDVEGTRQVVERYGRNITFVGIGVGHSSSKEFFERAFPDPHRSTCCRNDHRFMTGLFTEIAVSSKIIDVLGYDMNLIEYPHMTAFPPLEEDDKKNGAELIEPIIEMDDSRLVFPLLYMLNIPLRFKYSLKANALGVHPVAVNPAELSYISNKTGTPVRERSGKSPLVFVISPLLLFFMFLPAILYALLMLLRRSRLNLLDPAELSPPVKAPILPPVPVKRFRRNSLEPLSPTSEDELIPTVVIAAGPRGGEILAGTLANRNEAGLPSVSKRFFPLYLDCRSLTGDDYPEFHNTKVDRSMARHLPVDSSLTTLVQDIAGNPSKHEAVMSWLDVNRYQGTAIDVSVGCNADRGLARLALYQDLLSDKPVLHHVREEVKNWCLQHDRCQIFIVAGAEEDLGSGWLIDIAFHLRRVLEGSSIPIYAILDNSRGEKFCKRENSAALMAELKICQAGSGWPYRSMDRLEGVVTGGGSILLPVFDRVIDLKHLDVVPNPGASGAVLMEMLDQRVALKLGEALAGTAMKTRVATRHEENRYITEVNTSTLILGIAAWKERWISWIIRDTLNNWIGYELSGDMIVPAARGDKTALEIWEVIKEMISSPPLSTIGFWENILNGTMPAKGLSSQGRDVLKRELLSISATYLNGTSTIHRLDNPAVLISARIGRFRKLEDWLKTLSENVEKICNDPEIKSHSACQDAQASLGFLREHLSDWKKALLTSPNKEEPGLLQKIQLRLDELDSPDPSMAPDGGRFPVPRDCWTQGIEERYQAHIVPRVLANHEIPIRLWWALSADGKSLEIIFFGLKTFHLNINDILSGVLSDEVRNLVQKSLIPEMERWAFDEMVKTSKVNGLLKTLPAKDKGVTYVLHGFHEMEKEAEAITAIKEKMISPLIGDHVFADRVGSISIIENCEGPSEIESLQNLRSLPLIQAAAKIPVDLFSGQDVMSLSGRHDLRSKVKLLAQDQKILECAVIIVAGKGIQLHDQSTSFGQWFFDPENKGSGVPVTLLGDTSMENALFQVLLRQQDINGNRIDPFEALTHWQSLSEDKRRDLLGDFLNEYGNKSFPEDWEILLTWKANTEYREGRSLT